VTTLNQPERAPEEPAAGLKPPQPELRIDREGRWFADGQLVVHEKIYRLFCESLVCENECYLIRIGEEENPVIVEDAPFSVRRLFVENTADGTDTVRLLLNDGRIVALEPETLRASDRRSLYCRIPGDNLEARFSRDAFTMLGALIEIDSESGIYYLELNGRHYPLWKENI
jgi:hypothetical protein